MNLEQSRVTIIGLGNVGTNLARYMHQCGFNITCIIEPDETHTEIATRLNVSFMNRYDPATSHVFISVPDDAISDAAVALAGADLNFHDLYVAHTSGIGTSDELSRLSKKGATCGSFHPIQSFVAREMKDASLEAIGCGIEGADAFWNESCRIANFLGWKPLRIAKEKKALYHAACVFAGNFLTVLMDIATEALQQSAIDGSASRVHLLPMMTEVIGRMYPAWNLQGISGPAARRDFETIRTHLAILLDQQPEAARLYDNFTKIILERYPGIK